MGTGATGDIATVTCYRQRVNGAGGAASDSAAEMRPYVGVGVNCTTFFDNDFNDNEQKTGLSDRALRIHGARQGKLGVDYLINRDWLSGASVAVHG